MDVGGKYMSVLGLILIFSLFIFTHLAIDNVFQGKFFWLWLTGITGLCIFSINIIKKSRSK
jgi:hypothetical protein